MPRAEPEQVGVRLQQPEDRRLDISLNRDLQTVVTVFAIMIIIIQIITIIITIIIIIITIIIIIVIIISLS